MSTTGVMPWSYPPANNVTTTDQYPTGPGEGVAYMLCNGCVRVNFDVNNAAVYYQLGRLVGGAIQWAPERFLIPGFRSLDRAFDALAVRSAVAGTPAQVTVDALTPQDIGAAS